MDALYRKARAIAYRELADVIAKQPIEDQAAQDAAFEQAVQDLETWVDLEEAEYVLLKIRQFRRDKQFARAIQLLNKQVDHDSPLLHFKKRRDLFEELGWTDWANWQQSQMLLHFPREFPPYE